MKQNKEVPLPRLPLVPGLFGNFGKFVMKKKELGIYIHIPFCKSKCDYCDFISYPNKTDKVEAYFEAVKKEIQRYNLEKYNVTTIYIGGGTPSYVDSKYICDILKELKIKLRNNQTELKDMEITIEVNPGTVVEEKLRMYKNIGINRISIGLQSTNDNLLKQIGRIHNYKEFINTYELAKKVGFQNINVDLMIGLPNQTIQELKKSLEDIKILNPNHVSIYSLIVEEGTKIEKQLTSGEIELPDEEVERQMYWYVKNTLELNGYNHYEISNFAKKGNESRHNLNCWNQKEYIGLGIAAHSYIDGIRYSNTIDLEKYLEANFNNNQELETKRIRIMEEVQSLEDKKKEYMLLGLRKIEGVSISKFKSRYIDNPIFLYRKELEKLVEEKLISIEGDYIKLTNRGLDLANLVWEEFV